MESKDKQSRRLIKEKDRDKNRDTDRDRDKDKDKEKDKNADKNTDKNTDKEKQHKLIRFTKKASRIAGDLAFGTSHPSIHELQPVVPANNLFYNSNKNSFLNNSTNPYSLNNVIKISGIHSMEFYLDYLRFFLKYMDDADFNDCLNYSLTRNNLWHNWYIKLLNSINNLLINNVKLNPLPKITIENIDNETFQDRRIILLLLWHKQILNKLFCEQIIIKEKLFKSLNNKSSISSSSNNNNNNTINSQICVITKNKLKSYRSMPNQLLSMLLKNHLSPANLELIDGWQLRHDFPQSKINLINITDRFQVILDLNNDFYLPNSIKKNYPYAENYTFLSKDFINSQMDKNERFFIENYSSFTSPNSYSIPLANSTQNLVFVNEFSGLINNCSDIDNSLLEFKRILKPNGSIILFFIDYNNPLNSLSNSSNNNIETISVFEYIQFLISNNFKNLDIYPNLNDSLIKHNFKNIKFVKLGIPIINQFANNNNNNSTEHQHQHENGNGNDTNETNNLNSDSDSDLNSNLKNSSHSNSNSNLSSKKIDEDIILSMFSMQSSLLDLIRVDSKFDIFNIQLNKPDNFNPLKLWIDWHLNGINGTLIKNLINQRKDDGIINKFNIDTEFNFKIDFGDDLDSDKFNNHKLIDGCISGFEYIWVLTADV